MAYVQQIYGITYIGTTPQRFANMIHKGVNEVFVKSQRDMEHKAWRLAAMVGDFVEKGGSPHTPNAEPYLTKKKIPRGYGDRPLLATVEYLESITVEKTAHGSGVGGITTWSVGVEDKLHTPIPGIFSSPIEMRTLADVLEYGSTTPTGGKIPARPHWRPAWARFRKVFKVRMARL